jgi:hypothetical protein
MRKHEESEQVLTNEQIIENFKNLNKSLDIIGKENKKNHSYLVRKNGTKPEISFLNEVHTLECEEWVKPPSFYERLKNYFNG